jgi:integral membrane protein
MNLPQNNILKRFFLIGHIEGVSYLLLLFVAMPLRKFANLPAAVTVMGYIHGVLFILFCIYLALVMQKLKWTIIKSGKAFILSLIPFGTFYLHKL